MGPSLGRELTPLILAAKPPPPKLSAGERRFADVNAPSAFSLHSTFEEAIGEAEYPAASWWWRPPMSALAAGSAPSALVYPLFEAIDEHYSVYWNLS